MLRPDSLFFYKKIPQWTNHCGFCVHCLSAQSGGDSSKSLYRSLCQWNSAQALFHQGIDLYKHHYGHFLFTSSLRSQVNKVAPLRALSFLYSFHSLKIKSLIGSGMKSVAFHRRLRAWHFSHFMSLIRLDILYTNKNIVQEKPKIKHLPRSNLGKCLI